MNLNDLILHDTVVLELISTSSNVPISGRSDLIHDGVDGWKRISMDSDNIFVPESILMSGSPSSEVGSKHVLDVGFDGPFLASAL